MPGPFHVLVNHGAGSATDDGQLEEIRAAFAAAGASAMATQVEPDRMAEAMWDAVARGEVVVVAGGDGTISAAANVAVREGLTLGVLPLGTFNHFAKDLGIPIELAEAAEYLVNASPSAIDVAEVNGRCFVNNASIGVYPSMVDRREELRAGRGWGKIRATVVAVVGTLRNPPRHRLVVSLDGAPPQVVETSALFVGNGLFDDGGVEVGTRSSLTDGILAVYEIAATSRLRVLGEAIRAKLRGLHRAPHTHRWTVADMTVTSDEPALRIAVDGEPTTITPPLQFRCRRGSLQVLLRRS